LKSILQSATLPVLRGSYPVPALATVSALHLVVISSALRRKPKTCKSEATIETPDGRTCTTTGKADLFFSTTFLFGLGAVEDFHERFDAGFDTLTCEGSEEPRPQISIANATVNEGDTGISEATFNVTLSKASTNAVTVDYTTADGTATQPEDYQQAQGTLTFEANQTTATVTVPVSGDTVDEPDESFSVLLSNPQNTEIADGEGSATIVDDDEAAPTCQNVAIETDEDEQGSVAAECSDVDGNTLTYEIVDQATDGNATVDSGDLKYDPEPNFNGSDSFTYRASDGTANSDPATADVTVSALNDPPTTPGTITSDESLNNDGTFTLIWDASTDVDGDDVTYTLEKRDSDDTNWSEVASGLTSSSYTFGSGNAQDEGTWDFRVKALDSPAGAESNYSTAENLVKVDESGPNAPTLSFATTGQSFKATVNGDDWYKDSAKIEVADNGDPALADTSDGSGVAVASLLPNPFDVTQNGASTASRKVKDNANNESAAGTLQVHVDAANPTLDNCPTAGPFILNSGGGTQSVGPINASDGESGVDHAASTLSGSANTSRVGEKTVTFTAKDNVGHSATKQCSYSVIFNFDGFRSPVDNPGAGATPVFNSAKAGQSIPVKFGLGGNQGLNIIAAGYPKVTSINCVTSATVAPIEEYAASTANGGLTYDVTANQYNYVWKTQSTYLNKCFKLDLQLTDGTAHVAYFKFLK
jgi:hypothetical protein